jgi:hypothetical protein
VQTTAEGIARRRQAGWRQILFCASLILGLGVTSLPRPGLAGTIGFPVPRQKPLHLRFELVGDSFKEDVSGDDKAEANSGRGLVSVAVGLTDWLELYARLGGAEFNVDEALFNGTFGPAYGGGLRLRLFKLPWGEAGLAGQYLRFTSDDNDSAGARVEGEWQEVDLALGIGSRRFGVFQFYAGGAYHRSDITLTTTGTGTETSLESDIPFRAFVGVHLYPLADFPQGQFLVNLEVRFIGEIPQFTLGVQYAF